MAFTTNKSLTTLLLQNLNVRTNVNAPISSLYALYTNGQGQTFWGPSINPVLVSTLFLSIADNYISFSTYTNTFYNELSTAIGIQGGNVSTIARAYYSTLSSQLYTTNVAINSSVSSLLMNDSTLYGTVYRISIDNTASFAALSNSLALGVYTSYVSTIIFTNSTIYGVSSLSTFYNELDFLLSTSQQGLSSISTSIHVQSVSTSTAFMGDVNSSLKTAITSTTLHTSNIFTSLSTYIVYANNLSTFSSILTQQLLSTSDGLYTYISSNDAAIYTTLSSINASSLSTISTIQVYNVIINGFLDFSTNISSITHDYVSTFLSTATSLQLSTFFSTVNYISTYIYQLYSTTKFYSTFQESTIANLNSTLAPQTATIAALEYELSAITTSSILDGVYKTFLELEVYAENIVNSNTAETNAFTNTAYHYVASSIYGTTVSTMAASSFYVSQTINLTQSTFVGLLDFTTYTHFNVNIYSTINGSNNYTLDYLSNIDTLNYKQGNLFINVSTVNESYSNNNGKLVLNAYRWGYPTWQTESVCPSLSNSDYTLHYTYTIQNSALYTSLLNVYPRLEVYGLRVSRLQAPSVRLYYPPNNTFTPIDPTKFWRGEKVQVNWSNYSFIPIGQSNYNPMVSIDVFVDAALYNTFGPFTLDVSTAVITMPYIHSAAYQNKSMYNTAVRAHIVGKPMDFVESTIGYTIVPYCERITMSTNGTSFLMGNKLVGITDIGSYPTNNIVPTVQSQSGNTSYNNDIQYGGSNLFNGISPNTSNFIGPTSIANPDPSAIMNADISFQYPLSTLTFYNVDASAPTYGCNIAGNSITTYAPGAGNGYYFTSTFILTNSLTAQVFSI